MRGYPEPVVCNITFFLNPNNPKEETIVSDSTFSAKCGYNQDPDFYCTMWPGDRFLSDVIDYQLKLLPGVWNKCSVVSTGLSRGGCAKILSESESRAFAKT